MSRLLSLCAACCVLCSVSVGQPPQNRILAGVTDDGEFLVDTTGVHEEGAPAVGFDGTNFLVVWEDGRNPVTHIYGSRASPQGTVLDSTPIAISNAGYYQMYPAVGFDGTSFLVVWSDTRSGYSDIYGARVTRDGAVLDTAGFVITAESSSQLMPAIAFDGTNFLVVWDDTREGQEDIYGARVSPQGRVLDPSGIVISRAVESQERPALAFDGANFFAVWEDYRSGSYHDIYGARVTPQGTVLDPAGIAVSRAFDSQWYAAVSFDGTDYLVVWTDWRSGYSWDIYGTRVTPAGTVLDPAGFAVTHAAESQMYPALGFDGANFLAVWTDDRNGDTSDLYGAGVTPEGVVFDRAPIVTQEGDQSSAALARGPDGQLLLVYRGWAGTVARKTYDVNRVWGKMNPSPGVEEVENSEVRRVDGPTVVRGEFFLPSANGEERLAKGELLDISGRRVMELQAGANDVSRLAPGVYFVRSASGVERDASSVCKVVVTR